MVYRKFTYAIFYQMTNIFLPLHGKMVFLLLRPKEKVVVVPGTGEPAFTEAVADTGQPVVPATTYIGKSGDPRKEQLAQIARDNHDAAVRIIQIWLQDEMSKRVLSTNNTPVPAEVNE